MARTKKIGEISAPTNLILCVMFMIYAAICIMPLLLVLSVSFTSEAQIADTGYSLFPAKTSTVAYRFIFANGSKILAAYGYTIFATVVGTTLGILLTSTLAFPLSRKDFKYKNKFSFYVYFTMLFNGGMVPLYIVYTQLIPLKNSVWCLIIPNLIGGFNVLLTKTYFTQNIPDSLVESAQIDGASVIRTFFTIVMPLSKPVIATVGLFTAMGYWNDYFRNMLFVFNDSINNLQYLLYRIQMQLSVISSSPELAMRLGNEVPQESSRMAMVIVTIGPIIFLYPFVQKYFIKGLVIGAVKG